MANIDFENIVEDFEILEDWEDRYRYIIDLGKNLPNLNDSEKQNINKVEGCASQVWIIPKIINNNNSETIEFVGDSDAIIVKGLIAVLMALYNKTEINTVEKIDATKELNRLGLEQHLSSQRSNGLNSMILKINEFSDFHS
jgi:cysteine desulfuration protein SufE